MDGAREKETERDLHGYKRGRGRERNRDTETEKHLRKTEKQIPRETETQRTTETGRNT